MVKVEVICVYVFGFPYSLSQSLLFSELSIIPSLRLHSSTHLNTQTRHTLLKPIELSLFNVKQIFYLVYQPLGSFSSLRSRSRASFLSPRPLSYIELKSLS
ncbi:hypothetical protein QCA50_002566 [Cerrena zonata]|uniref:Uncharacterized protein n=1 Tax=Cerrena zonata TaxID=2478898 RepID=A0AAW0GU96_9APHY